MIVEVVLRVVMEAEEEGDMITIGWYIVSETQRLQITNDKKIDISCEKYFW